MDFGSHLQNLIAIILAGMNSSAHKTYYKTYYIDFLAVPQNGIITQFVLHFVRNHGRIIIHSG